MSETWTYQTSFKGTVGVNLDLTPTAGSQKILYEAVINAPLANDDATVKIYKDAVSAPNLIYDGYLVNRDVNGVIKLADAYGATTKFIAVVTGGSGDLIVEARYK